MSFDAIRKDPADFAMPPNLDDYERCTADFDWESASRCLDGLPGGGLNIAYEAVDRHVHHGKGDKVALRWLSKTDECRDCTYVQLMEASNRFANVLARLGVSKGDRVFTLCGRQPQLYIAAMGTLKAGAVFAPLFAAFGPEPVRSRMEIGEARVLLTTASLYRKKVAPWRHELPSLQQVLLIDDGDPAPGCLSLAALMAQASTEFAILPTQAEDMALLHFTSGTTGKPKGAIHVHQAVLFHTLSGLYALDLHPQDTYWCTADPGWVTGTSYGIIAPLSLGVTMVVDEAEFDAQRWYSILESQRISVWYTAPTAIRMLMKAGAELAQSRDLSTLRFLASVGEPLNPEAVVWGQAAFGKPFHDNWWQTETGGIMIANFAAQTVLPGSMGRPLPGITAAIVKRQEDGHVTSTSAAGEVGELALRSGWPSMFRGYLHEQARYEKCFADGWYLSGDLASCDAQGYFWFVGRADDVIKSAGHLIGPFEVESALLEHPAVAEAGVIGIPDPMSGEVVKAFVALKPGHDPNESLRREILGHARKRLGAVVSPKEIVFRENLPKTRSGKIMRRLLKARELGLPEGDISTLESDER
ncbi:acetate--CoA ligase [Marinobacterium rhizophilum]|uniref:acetate--CoA ligase n=1 Tax=Marinobacterium rhizophilum TaxID=420402 RepID=UPI000364AA85|nr:acetate--CoA ligase [Marinobacterium rhizophilum]